MDDSYGTYDGRKEEPVYDCPSCAAKDAELTRLRAINKTYEEQIAESAAVYADRDRLRAIVARVFPMQDGPKIPWSLAELIYAGYHAVFGGDQSLERLAERGGFGWGEVALLWNGVTTRERFRAAVRDYAIGEG